MLTEERYKLIVDYVNKQKTVTVGELVESIGSSESTVRRDLNVLDKKGRLRKIHGGAVSVNESFNFNEDDVALKETMFADEKDAIAKYAASTINKGDLVYIDAGTSTSKLIDYITERDATFVTNGFSHAKKLALKNLKVYIVGGEIKATTEAVVGTESVMALRKYNFTKSFIGTNGISLTAGFTTPNTDEASVKEMAINKSYISYVLADHSKFNQISSVTFADFEKVCIITDFLPDDRFDGICPIKEVMK